MEKYFDLHPEKRPEPEVWSPRWRRGYVATFELRNNGLYLKDLEMPVVDTSSSYQLDWKFKSILNKVFGDTGAVKVEWETGIIVLASENINNPYHSAAPPESDYYFLLEFENGNLVSEQEFDWKGFRDFKDKQFVAFQQTDEYSEIMEEQRQFGAAEEEINIFIRDQIFRLFTSKVLVE
jgi:hypothetical protein